jgi:hypothetical protein
MVKPQSWLEKHGFWIAIAFFVATRVVIWTVALTTPQDRNRPDIQFWSAVPMLRWDGGHYGQIMSHGYPAQICDTTAFFPLYPLVSRPFAAILPPDVALAVVSQLCSLAGFAFLYSWARKHADAASALLCVAILAVYPPAMFFSAVYSDSLLFLLVTAAVWLLDRQRIWSAAVLCALATATRPTGLALAGLVVVWAWFCYSRDPQTEARRWPSTLSRRLLRVFAVGAIGISGLLSFQLYLWHHYGRPDAFEAAQANWQTKPAAHPIINVLTLKPVLEPAFRPIRYLLHGHFRDLVQLRPGEPGRRDDGRSGPLVWNALFNCVIVGIAIAGLVRPGRIPRLLFLLPIFVFLMAYLADPVRGGRLVGIARYHLIAVPCFLWIATRPAVRRHPIVLGTVMLGLLLLQCVYVQHFVNWHLVS